jgi:hypothetical protein
MWRVSGKNAGRGRLIGWDGVPDQIRGNEGKGSGGIMLGTKVPGVGFQTPLTKARVGLESRWRGFGWSGWSGWQTWWDGWMEGWI